MKKSSKSGQVVIIILLILVVVLTVGLSIATRTVTDIKVAKQTELSNRAFNAAEAGIEAVLAGQYDPDNPSVTIGSSNNSSNYTIAPLLNKGGEVGEAFVFSKAIVKDDTQQVWLMSHKTSDGTLDENNSEGKNFNSPGLDIYWGNKDFSASSANTPAIELSVIYKEASDFKMSKGAYDPNTTRANNFITGVSVGNYLTPDNNFRFWQGIDLCSAPFSLPCTSGELNGNVKLYALRLRLLYNSSEPHALAVAPSDDSKSLPVQGRLISSTGNAGNVYRKVEVFESFPALPPIFDYVIFNGSTNSLQKN